MSKPFNAWKEGFLLYAPWLLAGAALTVAAYPGPLTVVGGLFLLAGLYTLFFFRDPPRTIPTGPDDIVAPADGMIVGIEPIEETPYYEGPCLRVSIFLNLFNVHINRAPRAGTIRRILYRPGQFKNAMKAETTECNEANTVWMDTDCGPMTVRQISGLIARRIVCRATPGDDLQRGQKFGMIKFGSRTELYLPPTCEVSVAMKEKVKAGSSVVARIPAHEEP